MRLKAEIWVMSYVRRVGATGAGVYIVQRGDCDAGAIFIRLNLLNGTSRLFGPAPAGLDGAGGDRQWCERLDGQTLGDREVDAVLAREQEFDPDIWIVEVEDRDGRHFLDDWLV